MSTLDEEDRREYYRIEDTIALEINQLSGSGPGHPASAHDTSILFNLLSDLHVSEFESQHLLRQLGEKDRVLNSFLKALSKRIDLLGQVVAHTVLGSIGEPQLVTLSEGGVQFHHPLPLPAGTQLSVKMVLLPEARGLMVNARVTHCDAHEIGNYEIGTEFEDLSDAQRQLLARHILQRQSQQRRLAKEQSETPES
ncbi:MULTISPECIES: PilZ domain-containing protein [unclassified Pseudomonas]|uniref:PilZ domain-containing protein n=1 Tax=unclassified Pseudomonas TaxID=196821 RepID=UPI002AC90AF3|nr:MULTISPECIES: PilZ domain-containing protein [unclassified Pseudomonas]MEB0040907.1 PilZ domain-containing protein [Pseudomonas sp. MH10]MEB0078885.1 PilZ domain-containing protein [Pseudomonas sp. MH10out]MEB0090033.1 PilZ domain-containing protein [Pseudomonas sp. CCI4.2]MEB0102051.1 PilZ domain-containing protein [Pseudomonas sp. CCI3.2]MEB0120955.1 PilZ domain-containing protein [Pseudomonas sp. CCI1.2]